MVQVPCPCKDSYSKIIKLNSSEGWTGKGTKTVEIINKDLDFTFIIGRRERFEIGNVSLLFALKS